MLSIIMTRPPVRRPAYLLFAQQVPLLLPLFILVLLLGNFPARAQHLRLAYYGETMLHYGVKAGVDFALLEKSKVKKNESTIRKAFRFNPGVAFYRHPQNHTGLIVSPEFTYQRMGKRGGLFEAGFSPSYFRYFLSGTTYRVASSGEFQKVTLAGGNAFLPTLSVGVGKDLSVKRNLPFAWYSRLNLSVQYPYNASYLPRFALEVGIRKKLFR